MSEDKKEFSTGFPTVNPEIVELFERLGRKIDKEENHQYEEILGELKIGHQKEAENLLRFFKAKKEAKVESKKKLADELEMVQREIETTENILENPEYKKEWDVYKDMLEKYEKEHKSILEKIKQAEAAAADLASIEEIEQKLKETE